MTFQQLQYVLEVARCGSINKAAQGLFVSQSSISKLLKDLEEELGVTLFCRTNRGITVTDQGKEFIGYARILVEQKRRLEGLYSAKEETPSLHFSISSQHYPLSLIHIFSVQSDAVRGDPTRVQQILLNLLSNAVKYTGEGGHISLKVEEKLSGKSGVGCFEFLVEDDGIGMSQEFLGKVFTPFERAEDPRVNAVQGTGLGLAITHNLVQMMNGTIRVESKLGEGTRFVVTIFLKLAQQGASEPASTDPAVELPPFPVGTKLLLVEDNDLNREIAQELLGMAGLDTVNATDGQQAVDLFSSNPPGTFALILMDIQLPVMNGYEAATALSLIHI